MAELIDVWRESDGQKYPYQIPDTWIGAGLAPGLTATEPNQPTETTQPAPDAPEFTAAGEPPVAPIPEEVV